MSEKRPPEEFDNVYDDVLRADAYDKLEFPGSYYLAFRDLPGIIDRHVSAKRALDFGCGTGRSTRFLRDLGFTTTGVDIAAPMLDRARWGDPSGDYRLVPDGDLSSLPNGEFGLVLSAFTFDNIPGRDRKTTLFRALKGLLAEGGRIISVVSSPEIYVNEWASFSTKDYPENRQAGCGDAVRIVMLDVADKRPVEDILWTDEGYDEIYAETELRLLERLRPLGREHEPYDWVSETRIAPWVIHVLA